MYELNLEELKAVCGGNNPGTDPTDPGGGTEDICPKELNQI